MPRRKSKIFLCKSCGKKVTSISQNKNCKKCASAKLLSAHSQIKLRNGPIYEKYRKNTLRGLGFQ